MSKCPDCDGTGFVREYRERKKCPTCKGRGRLSVFLQFDYEPTIPPKQKRTVQQ